MNDILIVDLPKEHGMVKGCWYDGYPVHKGHTKSSLNYATLYAQQQKIFPNQKRMINDFSNFKKILKKSGFHIVVFPFPKELNQIGNLHHDAVFVRDSGIMFKNFWIKANFSAKVRQAEAEIHTKNIVKRFHKKVIEMPKGAYIELGEVFYMETKNGSYYFGGLSRSNKKGHDFVRTIIKPDHYCLIKSDGYHLDTVFTPVLSKENELIAFVLAKNIINPKSISALKKFGLEIIYVDPIDSSGKGKELGNYAVNALIGPGVMLNCSKFLTKGVEDKLKKMGIKRYVSKLTDFRFAGGSYHCLTNEIYK